MPAEASLHAVVVTPSVLLRHCRHCTAFPNVTEKRLSRARPSARWSQQGKVTQRAQNVIAAASAQPVPLEQLLEVAERAAKAGAAVSSHPITANASAQRYATCRSAVSLLQVIAEKVDKPRDIEFKGATDLVTDTDKASEEAVLSVSARMYLCYDTSPCQVVPRHAPKVTASYQYMSGCPCRKLSVTADCGRRKTGVPDLCRC